MLIAPGEGGGWGGGGCHVKEISEMPFYIKCGSAAVWKYCGVRAHSHNADAAATVDQFFQHYFFFVCVSNNLFGDA